MLQETRDLLVRGKAPQLEFGEDPSPVDRNLEGTTLGFDELTPDSRETLLEFGDQTGRLGQVVSLHAVLDPDFHETVAGA